MEKNYNRNNNDKRIEFSSDLLLNFSFLIGLTHWTCIFGFGFSKIKILTFTFLPISILSWICGMIFIYFLLKIITSDILFSEKQKINIKK